MVKYALFSFFLFILSTVYTTQAAVALPSVRGVVKQLPLWVLPQRLKAAQAKNLFLYSHWVSFTALLTETSLPLMQVLEEGSKYARLRSVEQQYINIVEHLRGASHNELDRIIRLLSFDTEEVLPCCSRLSLEEARHMVEELDEFRLRVGGDINVENLSKFARERRLEKVFTGLASIAHDVISASLAGHGSVFTGFQKLYAAQEFAKMHDIALAVWRMRSHTFKRAEIINELNIRIDEEKLNMAKEGVERLEMLQEMVAAIDSPASRQAAIEYLAEESVARIPSGKISFTALQDVITEVSYLDALEELEFMAGILDLTRALGDRELRYLARTLENAARQ